MTTARATLRRALREDAPGLTTLIYRSKQSNGYDDAFMAACADELAVSAPDLQARPMIVAETDKMLGCVALACGDDPGEIGLFFVDPMAKRLGVGRALWTAVMADARARGYRQITLDADPAAIPFYEAMGCRIVAQRPSGSIPGRYLPQMMFDL